MSGTEIDTIYTSEYTSSIFSCFPLHTFHFTFRHMLHLYFPLHAFCSYFHLHAFYSYFQLHAPDICLSIQWHLIHSFHSMCFIIFTLLSRSCNSFIFLWPCISFIFSHTYSLYSQYAMARFVRGVGLAAMGRVARSSVARPKMPEWVSDACVRRQCRSGLGVAMRATVGSEMGSGNCAQGQRCWR